MAKRRPARLHLIDEEKAEIANRFPTLKMDGDCATWAIRLAVRSAGMHHRSGYLQIASDIVDLKKKYRANYSEDSNDWFEHHNWVPAELALEIMEQYFEEPFSMLKVAHRDIPLLNLAQRFREIPIALVGTDRHLTCVSRGRIYDLRDYTSMPVRYIMLPKSEVFMAAPILRKLSLDLPKSNTDPTKDYPSRLEWLAPGMWVDHKFGCYCDKYGPTIEYYKDDCATQAILHIMWDFEPGSRRDYLNVLCALRDDKKNYSPSTEYSEEEAWEWKHNHLAPSGRSITRVLEQLTGKLWTLRWYNLPRKPVLAKFAMDNSDIPYMGVLTNEHISAVKYGITYDRMDARCREVIGVIVPDEYKDNLYLR